MLRCGGACGLEQVCCTLLLFRVCEGKSGAGGWSMLRRVWVAGPKQYFQESCAACAGAFTLLFTLLFTLCRCAFTLLWVSIHTTVGEHSHYCG